MTWLATFSPSVSLYGRSFRDFRLIPITKAATTGSLEGRHLTNGSINKAIPRQSCGLQSFGNRQVSFLRIVTYVRVACFGVCAAYNPEPFWV